MDADLYDEFGNYIGPELESDSDDDEDERYERQDGDAPEFQEVRHFDLRWHVFDGPRFLMRRADFE